jgi:hypothetical protein
MEFLTPFFGTRVSFDDTHKEQAFFEKAINIFKKVN